MRRVSELRAPLQQRAGSHEVPEIETGTSVCTVTPPSRLDIVPRLTDFFHLFGQRQRKPVFASDRMKHPLAQQQSPEIFRSINLLCQCACPGEGLVHLGRRKALRGHQRPSKRELQVKLMLTAL